MLNRNRSVDSGAMRVLKPGQYDLITPGHGVPAKGLPTKCFHCRKPILAGENWRTHDNGQYTLIAHSACDAK